MLSFKRIVVISIFLGLVFIPCLTFSQDLKDGLYARFDTTKGQIVAVLYFEQVPLTVINFAGLAIGTIASGQGEAKKYYDGLIFHRVIKNVMILSGDPTGTGRGGPGYKFPDEFVAGLKHDSRGILSMANAGPGTNGSQFFITQMDMPWLDNKHTVFGKVVKGQDVVKKIQKGDKINALTILRVGEKAKNFKIDQASFDAELNRFEIEMRLRYPKAVKTGSGLMYVLVKEGTGPSPARGAEVKIHFTGQFKDGKIFDSSVKRGQPIEFSAGVGHVIKGWDEAVMTMKKGEKRILLIPYRLAYGEKGHPGAIPPKSDLIFDVELIDFK